MNRLAASFSLLLWSLFSIVPGPAFGQESNPFAGDAAAIAEGEALFQAVCTGYCHVAPDSRRDAKCPDLFDCEWKNGGSDADIFQILLDGVPNTEMVPFRGQLPDDMLWQIVAYVKSASRCKEGSAAVDHKPLAVSAHE